MYPPVLSMGLPSVHHIVLYLLAQLPETHSKIELTLQENEVSAAAWLDTKSVAEIVKSDDYGKTRSAANCYFRYINVDLSIMQDICIDHLLTTFVF